MGLMNHTTEESFDLVASGFMPGYVGDLKEGDVFSIAPVMRKVIVSGEPDRTPMMYCVDQVRPVEASYTDDVGQYHHNVVVNMIAWDELNLPVHLSYGSTYPVYILQNN